MSQVHSQPATTADPTEPDPLQTEHTGCVVCGAHDASLVARVPDFEYQTVRQELPYVRCSACGHLYLQERPAANELPRIYPPEYGNHDANRGQSLTFRIKSWLDARAVARLAADVRPDPRVLDVGCADGRLLDVCKRALPGAQSLHGIEISSQAARGALQKGYAVTVGTIEELDLSATTADLIFLQQVIEHVYRPDEVLRKLGGCLAPGGLLVVETPCAESLDARLFQRRYWGGYHAPRHFNLFTAETLRRVANSAGLQAVDVTYTPQPIHWAWSVRHFLAARGAPRWLYAPLRLGNPFAMAGGTLCELAAKLFTGRMSNMRVLLRRAGESVS